jgi:apolipoprotein N-acyltransferase
MIPAAFPLRPFSQWILIFVSFFLVAFGQPAWIPINGLIAGALGFALFWRVLLAHPSSLYRFILGTSWFTAVQLIQLSWFTSHPYWYIYVVYFFLSVGVGIQFGILSLFIRPNIFNNSRPLTSFLCILAIASLWTILEWSRLFVLTGLSWNPIGLALTSNIDALQAASIAGVFGLSFWVIVVNLLALWAWLQKGWTLRFLWITAAAAPYLYGMAHIASHADDSTTSLKTALVQTAFAPEELQGNPKKGNMLQHVVEEWKTILQVMKPHVNKSIDLIVLPEFVVPYGTYSDVYPFSSVLDTFVEVFGIDTLSHLPKLDIPLASVQHQQWFVNNAYWTQALANLFRADVLIGLEDAEDILPGTREYYSAAILVHPQQQDFSFTAERYAKRVLVPMGEYIPFEACRKIAEKYGVFGSFTCGKEALVMHSHGVAFSPSICYEETFGDVMREGRQKGADLFVNLTSDVWYPNSYLPRQHLDHARLRTVENGVPLIRACNTGITAAIDSLGRNIQVLGGDTPENVEWKPGVLLVEVPIQSYHTLYSKFGDSLIIGLCFLILLILWLIKKGS